MENLNAEQVKKALECCENECCDACTDCPSPPNTSANCVVFVMRQALALITSQEQRIKELAEEKRMLSESYDHLEETKDELLAERSRLTEENERLNTAIPIWAKQCVELEERCMALVAEVSVKKKLLDKAEETIAKERADTVRKMQERLIAEIKNTPNANEFFITAWRTKIDQIAKEMLEGENEN